MLAPAFTPAPGASLATEARRTGGSAVGGRMCDVFICSDSGVGLCDDDRRLLEGLGKSSRARRSYGSLDRRCFIERKRPLGDSDVSDKGSIDQGDVEVSVNDYSDSAEDNDSNNNVKGEIDKKIQRF